MKNNQIFLLSFADLWCEVKSNVEVAHFFEKYFRNSGVKIIFPSGNTAKPRLHAVLKIKATASSDGTTTFTLKQKGLQYELLIVGSMYFYYPLLTSLLQRIFTTLVYRAGGLVLHGSAVLREGKAHVFIGESGRGKTTIAHSSQENFGYPTLSDNHVFITSEEDTLHLHIFPFDTLHGRHLSQPSVEVASIYVIFQARQNKLETMDFQKGLRLVKENAQVQISESSDSTAQNAWQRILFLLLRQGKIKKLFFKRDISFWQLI